MKAVVKTLHDPLNVRVSADRNSLIVGVLNKGQEVEITDPNFVQDSTGEKWYRVRADSEHVFVAGFSMAKFLSFPKG